MEPIIWVLGDGWILDTTCPHQLRLQLGIIWWFHSMVPQVNFITKEILSDQLMRIGVRTYILLEIIREADKDLQNT